MADQRLDALTNWMQQQLHPETFSLQPLAGDASFRRYFRIRYNGKTCIAMDSPPEKEDCKPFIAIAEIFKAHGLQVPHILRQDVAQGFLLLSDLGDDLYFRVLNKNNADNLYGNAIRDLLIIQTCRQSQNYHFSSFDEIIIEELKRFHEWYLHRHLNLRFSCKEEHILADAFEALIQNALQQPQVCVHRDYHSRNLLALPDNGVGILDFQDAVWGPITYDLVSLIRDCYIAWPNEKVEAWAKNYFLQAQQQHLANISYDQFLHWFDWIGIQRHLKAIYIFARKFHRDENANYLDDIPRALNYVMHVSAKYPELKAFRHCLENWVTIT